MGFLDAVVGQAFRDEKAGRVVVFTGDRRNRGYVVRSEAEELKIKSFLKMFYFAHFSLLLLGNLLAYAWSIFFVDVHAFGRASEHIVRIFAIFLGTNCLLVWIPDFLLWRSYRRSLPNFVSADDAVSVSGGLSAQQKLARRALIVVGITIVMLAGILWLVCFKR